MKKIGREVAFLATGAQNPRNGEGSFLRLSDGRIMYAYTEYYGDSWEDHATARISAVFSPDEGESWSQPSVLIEKDADTVNIMSVSLFRMKNGDVGCLYLRRYSLRALLHPLLGRGRDLWHSCEMYCKGRLFCRKQRPSCTLEERKTFVSHRLSRSGS